MTGAAADTAAGAQPPPADVPALRLDGYAGPLDQLLALARAGAVDLARLPLGAFCTQLAAALAGAGPAVPLSRRADWLVMAATLLLLRSRLLGAVDEAEVASGEAGGRCPVGADRDHAGALARWLDGRPQLGRDTFARGRPEWVGVGSGGAPWVDVVEFLWAVLALFDADLPPAERTLVWRPAPPDLHSVPDAQARICQLIAGAAAPLALSQLLPQPLPDAPAPSALKRRSAWSSTFAASLELARLGEVGLEQDEAFAPIQVQAASVTHPAQGSGRSN